MKFIIILPTVRFGLDGFGEHITKLKETFSYETDFCLMDGSAGKNATINKSLAYINESYDFAIRMDDDILPPTGWQDDVINTYDLIPKCGIMGLDLSHTDEGRAYMMENLLGKWQNLANGYEYREAANINVVGCMHILKPKLMLQLGEFHTVHKYDFRDDGHYCKKSRQLGYKNYYIKTKMGNPEIVHFADTYEYLKMKQDSCNKLGNPVKFV